jgi:hypothetical protein
MLQPISSPSKPVQAINNSPKKLPQPPARYIEGGGGQGWGGSEVATTPGGLDSREPIEFEIDSVSNSILGHLN